MLKRLPNLISLLRIVVFVPAMAAMALATSSRTWFLALFGAALVTDALDGFLARRLGAESDLGRRLDSFADYVLLLIGIAGFAILWPALTLRELPWIVSGLAAFFVVLVYGCAKFGHPLGYHTLTSKILEFGLALSLVPLLVGWSVTPFHVMVLLQIISVIEQLLIAVLMPTHIGEVRTVWQALRLRRTLVAASRQNETDRK
jgi:phosphatidylglycerophosphate synthase